MIYKNKKDFIVSSAFILLLIAAIYGLIIRWSFTFPTEAISYKNILQAHSHVAFLGWGYIASLVLITNLFIKDKSTFIKIYNTLIRFILIVIFLMLISFPLIGYKSISIALLVVFGLASYVISFQLLKNIKGKNISTKLIRFGIYYYLLSSLATWFLAFVIITQGKSILYYNTIYFYLHFLYNGYFVFVLFGLLFKLFESQSISISTKHQNQFFIFLNIACIPAYTLSILWSNVSIVFNFIGFLASISQLISLFYLIRILQKNINNLNWSYISKLLLKVSIISYVLKIFIQIISALPYIVTQSLALKHYFIIGYLHLFTLGFMTCMLFLFLLQIKKLEIQSTVSKIGTFTFLIGIIGTEFLLFYQGFLFLFKFNALKFYNLEMLFFSFLLVIGLLLMLLPNLFLREKKN
ncbi:MAG: hypothetical protein R3342_00560 [Lutibacter sp.]|uniref:hypothetical protein n=1 Tax=Lutibacter sp. TaxID=1925666 RepID=UPI00299CF608|nr:hypothetical protein [Lutibacter sp.]MDX1828011.1 hypothetical protein [Lutibacter sp.]